MLMMNLSIHYGLKKKIMCISPCRKMVCIKDASGRSERRPVDFNCGKCFQCLNNKVKEWQVRLLLEQKTVKHSYFITLTYVSEKVPIVVKDDVPVCMTLSKRDLQLWLKKLRKKHSVRFFAIGEYGDHTYRPHYHVVLFSNEVIKHETIQQTWHKGLIRMEGLNPGRAAYVAKYHTDGLGSCDPNAAPPFRLMSRMPGLGSGYVQDESEVYRWHRKTPENGYVRFNGIKYNLPRYVKRKIYSSDELRQAFDDRPVDTTTLKSGFNFAEYSRYLEQKQHDRIRKKKGHL